MIRASMPTRRSTGARLLVQALLALGSVVIAGCATGAGGGGGGGRNPDVITAEEVASRVDSDGYELVQSVRPGWLRPRTTGTFSSQGPVMPEVFIDGSYYGPIDALRNVPTTSIDSIEFIGASDATTLYGTGYMGGVIHVHTRTAG